MNISDKMTPLKRALITIAVMTATLLQVLDTTIVNVALPHMQGSLGATPDQITWVLTSYLVASAIFMPLTGYFTDRFGQKNYLLFSIGGFVLASALCGAAKNLDQLVVFRLLQGVFGAALVPLSQAIITNIFPENERGSAMALWGMGVMIGPILGPTLGGYLTEVATWRWNFYINVPVGAVSLLLTWRVLPDTVKKARVMDWFGLMLISIAIGGCQYVLDRGNQADWFNATDICIVALFSVISFLLFLWYSIGRKNKTHVFNPVIFLDRNFALCSFMLALFGLGLFGSMILLPLMVQNLFHYPVLTTGLVMAPRGISAMISMVLVGKLIRWVDARWLMGIGTILGAIGMYFGTLYSFVLSPGWLIMPLLIQGFGLGMVFVALSAVAFATLPSHLRAEAAGLFSLLRTMGSSVGISIVATVLARHTQMAWNQLGGFINPYHPALYTYLQNLHLDPLSPKGVMVLAHTLGAQAQMIAFVDAFAFIMWSFILMLPLVFLLKRSAPSKDPAEIIPAAE
ncbi:MAG: DHA2 family efflux MFS transporter permease subunit [Gammaproteobacteria bacterium]|nr:DHA2 family efflux MFS transporter permease subunit [Gammaproteobacteria bacterium]